MHGVNPILPTPFLDSGEVDDTSLRKLIDFQLAARVHGFAILGFLGEAHKLSLTERRRVITSVVDQAAGAAPTWVGVRAFGAAGAIEQAREAEELGAKAVFVAPIAIQNDAALYDFFAEVASGVSVPVMIHDFPASFGTVLSPDLIARMAHEIPNVTSIKLEAPPVLIKLRALLELAPDAIEIFGGLGGEYFLEELQSGAKGIMTGFAFPEVLVAIYERFTAGDVDAAARTFDHYATLIRYEFQPNIGLAFRKHVYARRGIFASTRIRKPGLTLDDASRRELDDVIARVGLRYGAAPQPVH